MDIEKLLSEIAVNIHNQGNNIAGIIDSCTGEIQGRLHGIDEAIMTIQDELINHREYLSDIAQAIRELKEFE